MAPALILSLAMFGCDRIFYYPDRRIRTTPGEHHIRYEDVFFPAADGPRLHGWFLPADGPARGTVLHVHGNAANISAHFEFVHWLPAAGYNVLTFDYRGYGRSGGSISREGSILDAEAALDWLRARPDVDARRIVVFGQSIGGAISTVLVARRKGQVAALAIDSAFTAYREIAHHHVTNNPFLFVIGWWFPHAIPEGLDPIQNIPRIAPTPLLIVHGRQDRIVPWQMAQRLYDAAEPPRELWLSEDTNHMEVWFEHPVQARARLTAFFDAALAGAPGG